MSPHPHLVSYASTPALSRGRAKAEPESPTRTCYQRDRDRIIHSTAFRRLQYKTQVFVTHEGDHYRTRLTHSLEVAQITRSLARALGLDEDLAEALALAHDLGHPPFGHAGEDALDEAMAPYGGFDHNEQTFRVLTMLEHRYAGFDGLNLTWETLEGIVKHNGPLQGPHAEDGAVPPSIAALNAGFDLELSGYAGAEAQVAAMADDIAYNNHDVDDGLRAELFLVEDLHGVPLVGPVFQDVASRFPGLERPRLIHESIRRLMTHMVEDLLEETRRRLAEAAPKSPAELRALGHPVVAFSAPMRENVRALKAFLFERMYRHERVNRMTAKARSVVRDLFGAYMSEPERMPDEWRVAARDMSTSDLPRLIGDYIAGMTDRFAMDEHKAIFGASDLTNISANLLNPYKEFRGFVKSELENLMRGGKLPADLDLSRVAVEPPRDPAHGDLATNAALVLAKSAKMKPRDLADILAERLRSHAEVSAASPAGPGFINLRLRDDYWQACLASILRAGASYGDSVLGRGRAVNVEYVSANPTGPLTVGHARGAVAGDAMAAIMAKAGFSVTREYYINDAGTQVDTLARSGYLRYREALGEEIGRFPSGYYPGEYLKDVGQALAARDGRKWLELPESEWLPEVRRFAIGSLMELVRDDLAALGIEHDVFTSERALVEAGGVDAVLTTLEARGLIYTGTLEPPKGKVPEDWEPRPQTLFRATDFGDDVDRPLRKSDGTWTYFASDMANHLDKFRRGAGIMVDVWGADHSGYVKRMKAAVEALTGGKARLEIMICQLVRLTRQGVPVKMSKRAGEFVTLREVIDEVGKDVVRFIMLTRKNDAPLDFDLTKVMEQSRDNPVFYVQYAHARVRSVMRHAQEAFPAISQAPELLAGARLHFLTDSDELALIRLLAQWPRLVESAAETFEPHRVAFYLYDIAAAFHGLWTKGKDDTRLRFLVEDNPELTAARLALIQGTAQVIASGLGVFGVQPVEEMR